MIILNLKRNILEYYSQKHKLFDKSHVMSLLLVFHNAYKQTTARAHKKEATTLIDCYVINIYRERKEDIDH